MPFNVQVCIGTGEAGVFAIHLMQSLRVPGILILNHPRLLIIGRQLWIFCAPPGWEGHLKC